MEIRDAQPGDIPAITDIFADAVLNGTGSFETVPPNNDAMLERLKAVQQVGLPFLVAIDAGGGVAGYAYAAPYRPRPAYDGTVENSVYVSQQARGRGIGKKLLNELIERSAACGKHQMIAAIGDAENAASIRLHTACGFREVGRLDRVGRKFGRWLDVVLMQRALD